MAGDPPHAIAPTFFHGKGAAENRAAQRKHEALCAWLLENLSADKWETPGEIAGRCEASAEEIRQALNELRELRKGVVKRTQARRAYYRRRLKESRAKQEGLV